MSFAKLKKNSSLSLSQLVETSAKLNEKKSYDDNRFWEPTADKVGTGYAVIRFLPAKEGEDLPWVKVFSHGFKGPTGKWYIENSLSTIGQDDPVGHLNSKLWNSGIESDKEIARVQKRKTHYYSNIYVVSDPANPANNGKIFLYKYGKKIYDKIMSQMTPEFEDETPVNVFDFWAGADFKLKFSVVDKQRSYDKSGFDKPAELSKDDKKLEEIYNSLYSLKAFLEPKNFKTYAELEKHMHFVLGTTPEGAPVKSEAPKSAGKVATARASEVDPDEDDVPYKKPDTKVSVKEDEDGDEETLSYFANLAKK